jgi:pimeloyl-ACP methyl ester carboxylesterase
MAPAIDALSVRHRVITFSLETAPGRSVFDLAEAAIDSALDRANLQQAAIVGVSFGGLIASRYAARRPDRAAALVLVSTPAPRWRPDPRNEQYLRRPRLAFPLFLARAVGRLVPDVMGPFDSWPARMGFVARHLARVVRFPTSPTRMASWVADWKAADLEPAYVRIVAPTLVITGEAARDRVVPQASTLT